MRKRKRRQDPDRRPLLTPILAAVTVYFVIFSMLLAAATPEQYDIRIGAPAPVTIFATKDVEDTVTTQKMQDSAAAQVEYTYRSVDSTVLSTVMSDYASVCTGILSFRTATPEIRAEELTDEELGDICSSIGATLSRGDLDTVVSASEEELDGVLAAARDLIRDTLTSTLPEGQETAAINMLSRNLNANGWSPQLTSLAASAARAALKANMLIDEETTELNREKARESVEVQICIKGEAVVREGDIVTEAEYAMISALGLLKDSDFDLMLVIGLALITLLLLSALVCYVFLFCPELLRSRRRILLLGLIPVTVMILCLIVKGISFYLMPVSLGMMLVATMFEPRLGLFMNLTLGSLAALLAVASGGGLSVTCFGVLIQALVSGPVIALINRRYLTRTSVLLAGVATALTNFVTVFSLGMVSSASTSVVLINAAWAAAGGVLSAVLCLGLQPLLEWLFNLVTNAKLLELSNPNQPLLHRLLLEAPGTYHHSIIVANLADAAANAVGANALLARVSAYYHDVGKLKRPLYFKENQIGDNPHDRTDPRVSTAILTAHTKDGAQIARKEHLPEEIVETILCHHGDSPVIWFYDKARKLYGDEVDLKDFRYEGPRPTSREAAIVMLADIVEAATRSMQLHDKAHMEQTIRKLIYGKIDDGQLALCRLTFSDLDAIASAFVTVLSGVFHERIEYPDVKLPPRTDTSTSEAEEGSVRSGSGTV